MGETSTITKTKTRINSLVVGYSFVSQFCLKVTKSGFSFSYEQRWPLIFYVFA